jgi:hypothetical protein
MRREIFALTVGMVLGWSVVTVAAATITADGSTCPAGPASTEFRAIGDNGDVLISAVPFTAPAASVTADLPLLSQRYRVLLTTLAGGETFRAYQDLFGDGGPVVTPTVTPAPTPTVTPTPSPTSTPTPGQDCTTLTVTKADGVVFTLDADRHTLKNGQPFGQVGYQAHGFRLSGGKVYFEGNDHLTWFVEGPTQWDAAGTVAPPCGATPAPTPTPNPAPVVDLAPVLASLTAIQQQIAAGFAGLAPKPVPTCDLKIVSVQSPLASGEYRFTGGYAPGCLAAPVKGVVLKVIK